MGIFGRILEKQERQNNLEIIAALAHVAPHITATEAVAVCGENPKWNHQALQIETRKGNQFGLHRCRNNWFWGSGAESVLVTPVEFGRGVTAHVELIQKMADGLDEYSKSL